MKKQKVQKRVEAYCLHPSVPDSCTSILHGTYQFLQG